jgi:hypothetical protein
MSFDLSEYFFWEIRGTGLTFYIGMCQVHVTDQNISSEKSEALDSRSICHFYLSEYLFWEIRGTRLTRYVEICQVHLTNQNISSEKSEALDSQSMLEYVIWLIRTSLLRNQRHWAHSLCWNHVIWLIRTFFLRIRGTWLTIYVRTCWIIRTSFLRIRGSWLTNYVRICHLTDQNISSEKSEALDSHAILEYAKVIWLIKISFLRN